MSAIVCKHCGIVKISRHYSVGALGLCSVCPCFPVFRQRLDDLDIPQGMQVMAKTEEKNGPNVIRTSQCMGPKAGWVKTVLAGKSKSTKLNSDDQWMLSKLTCCWCCWTHGRCCWGYCIQCPTLQASASLPPPPQALKGLLSISCWSYWNWLVM